MVLISRQTYEPWQVLSCVPDIETVHAIISPTAEDASCGQVVALSRALERFGLTGNGQRALSLCLSDNFITPIVPVRVMLL